MSERIEVWPVAEEAASYISDGMIVGLGTGRAASMFVHALAARVKEGLSIRGVPTSKATETLAASLGIPLIPVGRRRSIGHRR